MARFTDVILKDSPSGLSFVGYIDDYSDGHARDNGAIHSTRNDPIKWPVENDELAQEAIWDDIGKTIRAATQEELDALAQFTATKETDRIAGLAETFDVPVALLAEMLAEYGLEIGITYKGAKAHITELLASGNMTADQRDGIGNLAEIYRSVEPVADDLKAIWAVLSES